MQFSRKYRRLANHLSFLLFSLTIVAPSCTSSVFISSFATPVSSTSTKGRNFAVQTNSSSQKLLSYFPDHATSDNALDVTASPHASAATFSDVTCYHATNALMLSINENGGLDIGNTLLGAALLLAVSAFVYANIVYTPEIVQNARLIQKEDDIMRVLSLVEEYRMKGSDINELRGPLEKVLGMAIEDYVSNVDSEESNDGDVVAKKLANSLRPMCVMQHS
mmetsp:Transcript_6435/g.9530  ORF Transcript_6435/g.9530 Transcript_6435/m.9530 type:complete len:221 (-) Transcript_6435:461-1123(-)